MGGWDQGGCLHLLVVFTALVFLYPNTQQMTADLVLLGDAVEADLTGKTFPDDLPFRGDRVIAMPRHGPSYGPTIMLNSEAPGCPPHGANSSS